MPIAATRQVRQLPLAFVVGVGEDGRSRPDAHCVMARGRRSVGYVLKMWYGRARGAIRLRQTSDAVGCGGLSSDWIGFGLLTDGLAWLIDKRRCPRRLKNTQFA